MRTPIDLRSSATNSIARLLIPLGALAGFGALGMLLHDQGVLQGLLAWFVSLAIFTVVNSILRRVAEGIAAVLGLISIAAGAVVASVALL